MNQLKGLADLFEAMKLLKGEPISLSILGQPSMPMEFYRKQFPDFEYFPPCTNSKVREIMQLHDALVLPSIVEGRASSNRKPCHVGYLLLLPLILVEKIWWRKEDRTTCPDSVARKDRGGY